MSVARSLWRGIRFIKDLVVSQHCVSASLMTKAVHANALGWNPRFGGPIRASVRPAAARQSNTAPEGRQRPARRCFIEPTEQKGEFSFERFRRENPSGHSRPSIFTTFRRRLSAVV